MASSKASAPGMPSSWNSGGSGAGQALHDDHGVSPTQPYTSPTTTDHGHAPGQLLDPTRGGQTVLQPERHVFMGQPYHGPIARPDFTRPSTTPTWATQGTTADLRTYVGKKDKRKMEDLRATTPDESDEYHLTMQQATILDNMAAYGRHSMKDKFTMQEKMFFISMIEKLCPNAEELPNDHIITAVLREGFHKRFLCAPDEKTAKALFDLLRAFYQMYYQCKASLADALQSTGRPLARCNTRETTPPPRARPTSPPPRPSSRPASSTDGLRHLLPVPARLEHVRREPTHREPAPSELDRAGGLPDDDDDVYCGLTTTDQTALRMHNAIGRGAVFNLEDKIFIVQKLRECQFNPHHVPTKQVLVNIIEEGQARLLFINNTVSAASDIRNATKLYEQVRHFVRLFIRLSLAAEEAAASEIADAP